MNLQEAKALRRDRQEAFDGAIAAGRLSKDPHAENYAGHYMYMGPAIDVNLSQRETVFRDLFKHSLTREYIQ